MASNSAAVPTTVSVATGTEVVMSITPAALSTTFTPPASCAEQRLTLGEANRFQLWLNDPQPVEGPKSSDCYPSQWIEQFTSSPGWDMSVAPMMSPLACPSAWTTVATTYINLPGYIACCPKYVSASPWSWEMTHRGHGGLPPFTRAPLRLGRGKVVSATVWSTRCDTDNTFPQGLYV